MIFDDFSAFLSMGGQGLYVWSAYGFAFVVFAVNVGRPMRLRRHVEALIRQRLAREAEQ